MSINSCLILAAGHGTRMGLIGNEIPKALWPLFEREILYFQLSLIQEQGIKNVYINSHHQSEILERYVNSIKNDFTSLSITVLKEQILLDSGGGILNCLQYVEDDYLLVINADVIFLSKSIDLKSVSLSGADAALFSIRVDSDSHYNRLVVNLDGNLSEIIPPCANAPTITFSGVSIIDVKKVKAPVTISRFFDTIANFQQRDVLVINVEDYEYVDLGTKDQYFNVLKKTLIENQLTLFRDKLIQFKCFKQQSSKNHYTSKHCFWSYCVSDKQFFCGTEDKVSISKPNTIMIEQFEDSAG